MAGAFSGKIALVTAAGSGIGRATAERLARDGAALMVSDINAATMEETAERLRRGGGVAHALQADAARDEDVERLVRKTVETLGGLHIAANVVGDAVGDAPGPDLHKQSVEGWDGTVAVCLRTAFLGLKHEIAHMIENGGGSIVNVTSVAGLRHIPTAGAAYSAAKAGVIQLTKFAAVTYADRGVRVNCIAPGVTPTASYYRAGEEGARMLIAATLVHQPIQRTIDTSEQAAAVAWLCSGDAAMITGQTIAVDGGWTAS
jgi:NAD(P)-dependent dehydrogenase (short-subunit alcohol dehydrogenase family)